MHERSLVSQLIKQVMEIATDHGPGRVLVVQLQVGEFSGVDAALLRNAYDDLVVDTPLRSTALHLQEVPLVAQCSKCESEFAVQRFRFECPTCLSPQVEIVSGEELVLESIVMEAGDNESTRDCGEVARGQLPA